MNTKKGIFPVIYILTVSFLLTTQVLQANEFTQLVSKSTSPQKQSNPDQLPMNIVLDHQGRPITLPTQQSALDYLADEMRLDESAIRTDHKATHKKVANNLQHKKLAQKVINDPSCRWLASRMKQLNTQLKRNKADHIETELSHRQQEWDCLQCSTTGPSQAQYSQCQYRR